MDSETTRAMGKIVQGTRSDSLVSIEKQQIYDSSQYLITHFPGRQWGSKKAELLGMLF